MLGKRKPTWLRWEGVGGGGRGLVEVGELAEGGKARWRWEG